MQRARSLVNSQAQALAHYGLEMCWLLAAALRLDGPLREIVVAGDPDGRDTQGLLGKAREQLAPYAVVTQLPADGLGQEDDKRFPALASKAAAEDGSALAYVCEHGACRGPVTTPAKLLAQLKVGWEH